MVEVEEITYSVPLWPEQLSTSLRIPGFSVADPAWWAITTDRNAPAYPDDVINRLNALENRAPASSPPEPRITTKLVLASRWDDEHAQAQAERKAAA
jgi:hypothetical protein